MKDTINTRRRERYKKDPEYRKRVLRIRSDSYKRLRRKLARNPKGPAYVRECKARVRRLGRSYDLGKGKEKTYTLTNLATALAMTPITIYTWGADGRVPKPTHKIVGVVKPPVYTKQEFDTLVHWLSTHLSWWHHVRKTHHKLIERLHTYAKP